MLRRKPDLKPRHVELAELVEPGCSFDIDVALRRGGLTFATSTRTHRANGSDYGLISPSWSLIRNFMPRSKKSPTTSANASGRSDWMSCAASKTYCSDELRNTRRST